MNLPPPLFVVLNQAVFWDKPTDYRDLTEAWPIYLQWYHRAEQAAAANGFRTYNHERDLLTQLDPADIPLNVLDNHPSAKVNQIYAAKLFETLTADISSGTLCPPGRAHGALPAAADVPLAPQRLLSVKLGETIRFWGYRADVTQLEPEKIISLTFGWQALAELKTNYTILITVLDETGQVWAKQESLPCQSACQTIFWPAGLLAPPGAEIIYWPDGSPEKLSPLPLAELPYQGEFRDVHLLKLPAEIPRGRYRLILGLVAPSGEQLPAYDEIAQKELAEGQIPLGFIVVE
jgi:hypothetical protein